MEAFFGIDIGTTNCKVVVCDSLRVLEVQSCATPKKSDTEGNIVYHALKLWESIKTILEELALKYAPLSIGITSMAEAGVLVNRTTGDIVSDIIPWHDKRSVACFNKMQSEAFDLEGFNRTGLHNAYKYSVYKLLMLKNDLKCKLENTVWLSASAYIAYCLTGSFGEDHTLALRTYCYNISTRAYDRQFIEEIGLPQNIFAPATDSGTPVGSLKKEFCKKFGLKVPIPVAVCGHDHMCAAVAAGAISEQDIFLSIGTTAVAIGNFTERPLSTEDCQTGYSFGLHTLPGRMTWMGSIQSAGGAIEWCKSIVDADSGGYDNILRLLEEKKHAVTGILFYPYLSGSGAPMLDINVRGSWIGLQRDTDRGSMIKSVLEGIAYEVRMVLEGAPNNQIEGVIKVVGGGSRNPYLMQIIADVLGRPVAVSGCGQETAVGAALLAAGMTTPLQEKDETVFSPDISRHKRYTEIYENGYIRLQKPLRDYFHDVERKTGR